MLTRIRRRRSIGGVRRELCDDAGGMRLARDRSGTGVRRVMFLTVALLVATGTAAGAAQAGAAPFMRYPNASASSLAFVARDELWTVPLAGGDASRLTHDAGAVLAPRFSPDGRWIAFTARRAGTNAVNVIPAAAGATRRLTYDALSGSGEGLVVAWTADSRRVVFLSSRRSPSFKEMRAFSVAVGGGLPQQLPLDHSGLLSYSPDGRAVAFNRIFRNGALPKRYVGGQAQDIYTYDFDGGRLDRITDWKGTDTAPMWHGRTIYFLSDRGRGFRANVWAYDLDRRRFRQITRFGDFDVDFPSLGGATIAFQQGGRLYAIDLPSERLREVEVRVPDDGARTAPRTQAVGELARAADAMHGVDYALSPDGAALLVSARGDLFAVSTGRAARNLTGTPGADEDHPSWSADGRMIAYQTDATGEQQIALRPYPDGRERILTRFATGYFYAPVWSPAGDRLAVADANHALWLVPLDGAAPRLIARDPYAEIRDAAFSPDGRWLAYSTMRANRQRAIHLADLTTGRDVVVSGEMNSDRLPRFSADGRLLIFVSQRNELPLVSDRDDETIIATLNSDGIFAATLDRNDPSPLAPRAASAQEPLRVDPDGLMSRAVALPITPAVIAALEVRGRRLFYETRPPQLIDGDLPGQQAALRVFDLATLSDRAVLQGLDSHSLSGDGGSVAYRRDGAWRIAATAPASGDGRSLALSTLRAAVDPRQAWSEMFENAWRLDRDVFFSRAMNGDDWQAVHDAYVRLLPHVASEDDLLYLLGQLQGELASSHTFVGRGASFDTRPAVATGRLGADYALDARSGRYRLARILSGDNTRAALRSPLTAPGLDLHEGELLLAVNGRELRAPDTPDALLVGAGHRVTLTVAASPDGARRDLRVEPLEDEAALRRYDWIERNRARVERLSHGEVGYVALGDFAGDGWGEFVRQFYPQATRRALVIDVRWNRGGFTSQAVLNVLLRPLAGSFVNREGAASPLPVAVAPRAMVTLLNWGSGSDGDQFPYYFRRYRLGPLVGTRSWGGVQGINGPWRLMDGTFLTIPKDSLADPDGHWIIENAGVAPDIVVDDRPDEAVTGGDVQLEAAVRAALDRARREPAVVLKPPPPITAYPRAGLVLPASFAPDAPRPRPGRPPPAGGRGDLPRRGGAAPGEPARRDPAHHRRPEERGPRRQRAGAGPRDRADGRRAVRGDALLTLGYQF